MKFRADEISSVIQREIEQFSPEVSAAKWARSSRWGTVSRACTASPA